MATKRPALAAPDAERQHERFSTRGDIAAKLALRMAQDDFQRGDLAELRRMNPDSVDSPVFLRLLVQEDLFGPAEVEGRWALVLHGIALMTPTGRDDGSRRSAHDQSTPVGRALYLGGDETRTTAFYSEARLKRLLTSRGRMTRTLLARAFRMLAAANAPFSWREMANFIHDDGFNQQLAEQHRRRFAREYFRAQHRSQAATTENG